MLRRRPLPLDRRVIGFYIAFALIGTVIPNAASYKAYTVLPSGIMSLLLSLIPMMAFPIALIFGLDRFSIKRMAGLSLGLFAILMIIGVPDALPNAGMLAFIPLGLIPSLMYAFEGNFVARFGTGGAGPLQLLLGASIAGVVITGPIAVGTGQWINPIHVWGIADFALIASALIHTLVYTLYVMIVRNYGPVFSVQVSYVVTASGLGWAMLILGERYSGPIWLALAVMFVGIYLVSPDLKGKKNDGESQSR
jgi:drug/metabolite transporter (DMT)-like permease